MVTFEPFEKNLAFPIMDGDEPPNEVKHNNVYKKSFSGAARSALRLDILTFDIQNKTGIMISSHFLIASVIQDKLGLKNDEDIGIHKYIFFQQSGWIKLQMSENIYVSEHFEAISGKF